MTEPSHLSANSRSMRPSILGLLCLAVLGACFAVGFGELNTPAIAPPDFTKKTDVNEIVSAIKALTDEELMAIRKQQISGFTRAPMESNALDPLLLIDDVKGDRGELAKLTGIMAARTLRDVPVQMAAIQFSAAKGNFADVFYRYDALIRTQLDSRSQLFEAMNQILRAPSALEELAKVLGTNPPWRSSYLNDAFRSKLPPETAYQLLNLLKSAPVPPQQSELAELINRLLSEKMDDTAYFVWLDFLSDADLKKAQTLFDGGFDLPPRNLMFDWTLSQKSGAEAQVTERAVGSSDHVLRVQFTSFQGFYGDVQQFTRLQPGHYIFRGQQKAEGLKATSGLSWILWCRNNNEIGRSKPMTAETDWSEFQFSFVVPPEGCATQFLRLESASRLAADQNISGTLYFDDLAILPADGDQTKKN